MATLFKVSGDAQHVEPINRQHFTEAELQALVQGDFEFIFLPSTREYIVVNQNGDTLQLLPNSAATNYLKSVYAATNIVTLVGDCVVVSHHEVD